MPTTEVADALIARAVFGADGLLPAVCQHAATGEVLMVGYQDAEAIRRTLAAGKMVFWSRSRAEYWTKGETSGHLLALEGLRLDCDGDCILAAVRPQGPTCHTGSRSCFGQHGGGILATVAAVLADRRDDDPSTSYTARLLNAPREFAARKVGEESVEVLLAAPGSDELVERGRRSDLPRDGPAGTGRPRPARPARRARGPTLPVALDPLG